MKNRALFITTLLVLAVAPATIAMNIGPTISRERMHLVRVNTPAAMRTDRLAGSSAQVIVILNQPNHGTLSIDDANNIIYVPATDYQGYDGYSFRLIDPQTGKGSETFNIMVRVAPF